MKLFRIFLLIFVLIANYEVYAQNVVGQLRQRIAVSKADTAKVNAMNKLSDMYIDINLDSAYYVTIETVKLASRINYRSGLAAAYKMRGYIEYSRANYDSAITYFEKEEVLRVELNDQKRLARCFQNIGNVFKDIGDFPKTLMYYQKALFINEKIGNKNGMADSYNNIGAFHYSQKNYKKAIESYEMALKISEESKDSVNIASCLNNIGTVYLEDSLYDKAIENCSNAMKIFEKIKYDVYAMSCLANIAICHQRLKHYTLAISYFETAMKKFDELGIKQAVAKCLTQLAIVHSQLKDYQKTLVYANQSLKILRTINAKDDIKDVYQILYETYDSLRDYKNAYLFHRNFIGLRDSMYNVDNAKLLTQKLMQYDFDKKDVVQRATLQRQRIYTMSFIIGFVLVLALAFVVIRNNLHTKKINRVLNEQKTQIEKQLHIITEQKNNITSSIFYAQRIQRAILPPVEEISQLLPNCFIFYRPRDIVSGDFYWFTPIFKDEKLSKLLVTAADCTGHGVPGAFMSMLGLSLLNEIVIRNSIHEPHSILNHLRSQIKVALRQSGKEGEQKDGMDIALVIIDFDRKKIQFAGANNPLYICRDNELIELKADRMPVGIHYKEKESFTLNEVDLLGNESLYLLTDGYVDQIGGNPPKKFLSRNFKTMLLDIQGKPMVEQLKVVEDSLEKWKDGEHQVDDILVIGFQIDALV